jgi:hypothetical protein
VFIEICEDEAELILSLVEYGRNQVRSAPDTPYSVRQDNLGKLDALAERVRSARNADQSNRSEP